MDDDALRSARQMVEKAERLVEEAEFDPDAVVTESDVERLTPWNRLVLASLFIRKLQLADVLVREEECFPDPFDRDSGYGFRANDDAVVVYLDDNPAWHMEKCEEQWKYFRLSYRVSGIDDPESETPERLLREIALFTRKLETAANELEERGIDFPDPSDPDSEYRFKANENVVVAYRDNNPIWHLRRDGDDWKSYKLEMERHPDSVRLQDLFEELEPYREVDDDD